MTDVNLTGEAREAYMEAIAKKSVNLSQDERMAFMDALMRESAQATEAKQNREYSQRGDDYLLEAWKICEKEKPAPRCPYCGSEMDCFYSYIHEEHYYICSKCRASSPVTDREPESYTAAMQHWQEPNRVLTLKELKAYNGFVWCEYREHADYSCPGYVENGTLCVDGDSLSWEESQSEYGKYGRCWLRKPTQEEREAVPWGDD